MWASEVRGPVSSTNPPPSEFSVCAQSHHPMSARLSPPSPPLTISSSLPSPTLSTICLRRVGPLSRVPSSASARSPLPVPTLHRCAARRFLFELVSFIPPLSLMCLLCLDAAVYSLFVLFYPIVPLFSLGRCTATRSPAHYVSSTSPFKPLCRSFPPCFLLSCPRPHPLPPTPSPPPPSSMTVNLTSPASPSDCLRREHRRSQGTAGHSTREFILGWR